MKQHKNLSFVIVLGTDGTNENLIDAQRYIEKIKGEIGNNRLTSFVNISNKQMSDVYYLMDFFVMPSRWESFGRTAVEAMSRKNIVLGRGVDGLYEVIGNDRYIFETSEDVSNILINLLESKEDFKLAKNYFYNRYFELYGYKDNVKRYKEIYDKVI